MFCLFFFSSIALIFFINARTAAVFISVQMSNFHFLTFLNLDFSSDIHISFQHLVFVVVFYTLYFFFVNIYYF